MLIDTRNEHLNTNRKEIITAVYNIIQFPMLSGAHRGPGSDGRACECEMDKFI